MPFISCLTWNGFSNEYDRLRCYHFTQASKSEDTWPKHGDIHSNPRVIKILLKLGGKCMRKPLEISFFVVPWCFRNALDLQHLLVCEKEYVLYKVNKYEKRMENNPKSRSLNGFYFDKLLRKRKELQKYVTKTDVYMNECEEYLENIIQDKK
jgi:hypothetical protein